MRREAPATHLPLDRIPQLERSLAASTTPVALLELGLAVMDGLHHTPESPAAFAHARHFAEHLLEAIEPDRGRFRALREIFEPSPEPRRRALRVALLALGLGRQRALARTTRIELGVAGLCLDLGHTLWPDRSSGEVQRRHPHVSVDLLAGHGGLGPLARAAILGHHERLDGGGFPLGLSGDKVPLPARLLGLCTAYVAASTPPAVGPPVPPFVALARLAGPGFDARLRTELEALLARRDLAWSLAP